ncbi:hypothetical protein D3C85_1538520 [compost metagenome]
MRWQMANLVIILLVTINRPLFKAVMNFLVVSNLEPCCEKSVQICQRLNFPLLHKIISLGHKALVNKTEEFFLFTTSLGATGSRVLKLRFEPSADSFKVMRGIDGAIIDVNHLGNAML